MGTKIFQSGLQKLYKTGEFADFSVICNGSVFKVHRIILSSQSGFFLKVCNGGFQEGLSKELDLSDDPICYVDRLIDYFYSGDYSDETIEIYDDEGEKITALSLHVEMYALGDKYDAPGLCKLALAKYQGCLKSGWLPQDFLQTIARIYETTSASNRELRDAVVAHTKLNIGKIRSDQEDKAYLTSKTQGIPEYASDLLESYFDNTAQGACKECGRLDTFDLSNFKCWSCENASNQVWGASMEMERPPY